MDPADNATLHPAALVGAQSLRRMGFEVKVEAMDWSTLTQRRASKEPVDKGGWNVFITNGTIAGIANPLIHTFSKNRSEEHTSELQSLMRISYAVFCLKKKKKEHTNET